MNIEFRDSLLFVSVLLEFQGQQIELHNCLLDTGSAGTIFATDQLASIGVHYEPDDIVHQIYGVGGTEFVFTKQIDRLHLAELTVEDFEIEVGAMDYGFPLDAIIGLDFLMAVRAILDLDQMRISLPTA